MRILKIYLKQIRPCHNNFNQSSIHLIQFSSATELNAQPTILSPPSNKKKEKIVQPYSIILDAWSELVRERSPFQRSKFFRPPRRVRASSALVQIFFPRSLRKAYPLGFWKVDPVVVLLRELSPAYGTHLLLRDSSLNAGTTEQMTADCRWSLF